MLLIIFIVVVFIFTTPIHAIDSPTLSSPTDNSTISSGPTLTWQSVINSIQYKILIDNESSITSPYIKDPYYTTNIQYSPQQLSPGLYYWKVGAKDSGGTWFWSNIWSFTLSDTTPTPTVTPTTTSTPTQSGTTNTPTPSSTFSISNIPTSINSDQIFSVNINLNLPSNPNSKFYLKGAFKKSDSSNYFGLTKVNSSWIKNNESYSNQFSINTDSSGNFEGSLEIQPNVFDSGYEGSGSYIFKVARYSSSGSGPTWSNEVNIEIKAKEVSDESEVVSFSRLSKDTTKTPTTTITKTNSFDKEPEYSLENYKHSSIAGVNRTASSSPILIKNQQINFLTFAGGILVILGIGSIIYLVVKNRVQS